MPNGGSDNCAACGFNKVNKGKWAYPKPPVSTKAYCTIRGISINNPLWTYCANYKTRSAIPDGPVFSTSLYEGYCRIPWNGRHEPKLNLPGVCLVCSLFFEKGIEVRTDEDELLHFCSNKHYVLWWKDRYPGIVLTWDYQWD